MSRERWHWLLLLFVFVLAGAFLTWLLSGWPVIPDGARYERTGLVFGHAWFESPSFPLDRPGEYSWEFRNLDFPGGEAYLSILTTCGQKVDYWKLPLEIGVQLLDGSGREVHSYEGNLTNVFWEKGYEGFLQEGKDRRWVAHSEIGNYAIIAQGVDEQFTPCESTEFIPGYSADHWTVPISRSGNYRIRIEVRPLGALPAGLTGRWSLEKGWK